MTGVQIVDAGLTWEVEGKDAVAAIMKDLVLHVRKDSRDSG